MSRFIQCCVEYCDKTKSGRIGAKRRGIYVLYKCNSKSEQCEVRYIGMTDFSIRNRLAKHKRKKKDWTHFSAYAVWPNVSKDEIRELEGLFRHIFRKDRRTIVLNLQRRYKDLKTTKDLMRWKKWTEFPFSKGSSGDV